MHSEGFKVEKNSRMKTKFTFFFPFYTNSNSISPLGAMKCSTLPSTQFFLSFSPSSSSSFTTTTLFFGVFFFGMGTGLRTSYKSKSPSTCENWCFNLPLFAPPSDSPPFHSLGKAKNAFLLTTTLWGSTKLTMSILELVKNGGVDVLSTMSSIHNIYSILIQFEQQGKKRMEKNKKWKK